MKTVIAILPVALLAVLVAGCTSSRQAKKDEAAAVPDMDERLERVTKEYESLVFVIRSLKPEAFEEVGLYRIQPGDTGAKIAMKHGISLADLVALNPDVTWTKLKVWQVLRVRIADAKKEPNQSLQPTTMSVTDRAAARSAPATVVADL